MSRPGRGDDLPEGVLAPLIRPLSALGVSPPNSACQLDVSGHKGVAGTPHVRELKSRQAAGGQKRSSKSPKGLR